jgi:AraC-like DNA-binding protein
MARDVLSDVLRSVRMRNAVFFLVSGEGSWVAEAPASSDIARAVMPGADHVIEYHVVTAGECWATVAGEPPRRLGSGDVVLLPQGDAHAVASHPGLRGAPDAGSYFDLPRNDRPFRMRYRNPASVAAGADAPTTALVCGFIALDTRPFNPLLATLPRLLHLPADRAGPWSREFAQLAATESAERRPGGAAVLERLGEMMFVDALRKHLDTVTDDAHGWFAGLKDRHVGRALALLHERPAEAWTIEALGERVGLSRSALQQRFTDLVGLPPIQYLAQWRMQLASQLLRDTHSTMAAIALEVGYDSEAAFVRAFKRLVGIPPATWRRERVRPVAPPSAGAPSA